MITNPSEDAVIGRKQIDNFIMGSVYWNDSMTRTKSELVDATAVGRNGVLLMISSLGYS